MANIREHGRQRAPIYSDDELMPILQELHIREHGRQRAPIYSVDKELKYGIYDGRNEDMLSLLEDFINRVTQSTQTIGEHTKDAFLEEKIRKIRLGDDDIQIIGSVSCQVIGEILNGSDAHAVTIGVLKNLRNFSWREKLQFTLTAFAVTFGDFWLLIRIYANNVVNEPNTVDQREETTANKDAFKFQIQANNDFIKTLLNTHRCLNRMSYFYRGYVQEMFEVREEPYMHTLGKSNRYPIYVYWLIRCAIVAATQIIILSSRGLDQYLVGIPSPKESDKLNSLNEYVTRKESEFRERNSKWHETKYLWLYRDIVEMMNGIINPPHTDLNPLYHGVTKKKDPLDALDGKRVLLLISGLNITPEDITNLKNVTIDSEKDEIVWIPVLEHTTSVSDDAVENKLETLQNSMPWYSILQPSLIKDSAIEAFKIEWGFRGRPILVFLSPSSEVLNFNAIYMLRIWKNLHVDDLTSKMELQLWEKETWNLKLLVNDIDPIIQEWIRDERYILMYGGNDIEWMRNFISQARTVARNMLVHIEMVYMGTSHNKDHGRNVQEVITTEQLSHCLPESSRAYFWYRLNSMIFSKEELGKMHDPSDKISQEIQRFNSHEEWVLLAKGSTIIGHVPCRIALNSLEDVQKIGQCCSNYKYT